jgi:anti-sigma28 factor (negative regulator of flagellin synthesis)
MFAASLPMYKEALISLEAGFMRNRDEAAIERRDSRRLDTMAGMSSSHKGDRKLERLSLARTRAEDVEKARLAESLIARSAGDDDVRSELVERLREEIAKGTYRVRSADVAAKMMGSKVR